MTVDCFSNMIPALLSSSAYFITALMAYYIIYILDYMRIALDTHLFTMHNNYLQLIVGFHLRVISYHSP